MFDWIRSIGRFGGLGATALERARRDYQAGRFVEAEAALRGVLTADPRRYEALLLLGHVLRACGRLDESLDFYRQAVDQKKDFTDALIGAAVVLNDLGRPAEAVDMLVDSIKIDATVPDAYANLGNALQYLGRLDQAVVCYQQALALDPAHATAQMNLGNAYGSMDRVDEAADCFRRALALDGELVEARWALAMSQLPSVYGSADEATRRRAALGEELRALDEWFQGTRVPLGARAVGSQQPFYLAYQEEDNRDLLSRYGDVCVRLMDDWADRNKVVSEARRAHSGRLRVGVVSEYFWDHSVWNAVMKGWFEQIDADRFELHAFHLGSRHDEETQVAMRYAESFEEGGRGLLPWVECIRKCRPDVLIYPNIGNDPMALKLACLRLSPVQVTSWGHPETTGLRTLDYFLSAQCMEPDHAHRNYRETLVTLPHLGTYYRSKPLTPADPQLSTLGLDERLPMLLCPGTPFKYGPAYDAIIVELCRRLGRCQLVFFDEQSRRHATDRLRHRLGSALLAAGLRPEDHLSFVPWLDAPRYHGLMERADVLLDTVGFSGFNVAMQAIERALPVVAWEGRFLRGRFASGILRRMDMHELVATSVDQYVSAAARLVEDREYRARVRGSIAARRTALFEDTAPIRELERFLGTAARGEDRQAREP
ncbi:MAG: tetratricopeptide repeat protein [Burkholderiales bacterium]